MEISEQEINQLQEKLNKLTARMQAQGEEKIDNAADQAKRYAGKASEYLQEKTAMAKDRAIESGQKVHGYAKENPWQVAGIAAGVAAALGFAMGCLMGRDRR